MQIVKNLFSRVTAVWSLYCYVTQVNVVLKSWPGTNNEIRLRAWLLDNLALLSGLVTKTVNPVDDAVVYYTVRIIENDTAWKILYNMLSLANGLRNGITGGETVPAIDGSENTQQSESGIGSQAVLFGTRPNCIQSLGEIENTLKNEADGVVENPLIIISAVGLILQIIQYLRNR
jgi:hypothetical protein